MQIINYTEKDTFCSLCGTNIAKLGNFSFTGEGINTPRQRREICSCKKCKTKYILQYNLFDSKGHINSFVFNGDPNDSKYDWQDILTPKQKEEIGNHLNNCEKCNKLLINEMASDAIFASILHNKK